MNVARFRGDCFNCGMLGMEVVVISGWVGLGQKAMCGNGGGSMGRASFLVKRGGRRRL